MQTFSIRDLHERSNELTREVEAGHLSLVTKRGQPLFVAVPFSEELLDRGTRTSLAEHLYKKGVLSTGKAAKVAGISYVLFLEHLSRMGIAIVDYPADELEEELRVANL